MSSISTKSGVSAVAAVGSVPNSAGAVISGSTLTLEPADGTNPGLLSILNQTITGAKTFSNSIVLNGQLQVNGGNNISFGSTGNMITLSNGPYGVYAIYTGNTPNTAFSIDTNTTANGVNIVANNGFNFSATATPAVNTQTVDWTTGSSAIVSAASTTATLVVTFSNGMNGGRYILQTIGKTGRVWTLSGVKWAGGTPPTVTAVDGAIDLFELYYNGTVYIGKTVAQNVS